MVQQALKNNGSEIGDLMKLAHNSLYLWDQWTLCYERMLHMTPRTFSVNTPGAAGLFILNVVLRMLQRTSRIFQWGVALEIAGACSAPHCLFSDFLCRRLRFPKLHSVSLSTLCPWQNQFQSVRLFSGSNACPALYTMNQRSSVDGLGFPPSAWSRPRLKKIHLST